MSDGTVLARTPFSGWKLDGKVKDGYTPESAAASIREKLASKNRWALDIKGVPGERVLREWVTDGIAEAVDGCRVEPDGRCSHNSPSWLLAFGYI